MSERRVKGASFGESPPAHHLAAIAARRGAFRHRVLERRGWFGDTRALRRHAVLAHRELRRERCWWWRAGHIPEGRDAEADYAALTELCRWLDRACVDDCFINATLNAEWSDDPGEQEPFWVLSIFNETLHRWLKRDLTDFEAAHIRATWPEHLRSVAVLGQWYGSLYADHAAVSRHLGEHR